MNIRRLYPFYQLAAGACDASTGLLLILAPAFTLRLMGIRVMPTELITVSFIGAFVFGVGLSYLVLYRAAGLMAETGWRVTGLVRLCVGGFVGIACARQLMEPAWLSVSVTDLALGGFQLWAVRSGWLRHE